jgi:hypothetical protein
MYLKTTPSPTFIRTESQQKHVVVPLETTLRGGMQASQPDSPWGSTLVQLPTPHLTALPKMQASRQKRRRDPFLQHMQIPCCLNTQAAGYAISNTPKGFGLRPIPIPLSLEFFKKLYNCTFLPARDKSMRRPQPNTTSPYSLHPNPNPASVRFCTRNFAASRFWRASSSSLDTLAPALAAEPRLSEPAVRAFFEPCTASPSR